MAGWFLIKRPKKKSLMSRHFVLQCYTVHAQTCSTRPWRFRSQKILWRTQIIYKVKASADACLSGSRGFFETWKQASIVRKMALRISRKDGKTCPRCLWDLKGGCDHAVSLDLSALSSSLSLYCCCCSGKKNCFILNQLLIPPSSFCANVWPPVHLLMWIWWAKPFSSFFTFFLGRFFFLINHFQFNQF